MTTPLHANVSQVATNLWVGGDLETGRPTLASIQLAELGALGITDIVDCRIEWTDQEWVTATAPDIGYCWLGVDDAGQQMPDEWFDAGTRHIRQRLGDGGTVLVHCHMGINRGPSMAFAALLALGWDPAEALDRIRERRSIAHIGYAEDAFDWWLRKNRASRSHRDEGRRLIVEWRRANHLDVATVIRNIRLKWRMSQH